MGRPRQVSDEQIQDAARSAFLEHGPTVSLEKIARGLGISGPALLRRVGSKEELLLSAMAPERHVAFDALLRGGPKDGEPLDEQLIEILLLMTEFLRSTIPRVLTLRARGKPLAQMVGEARGPAPVRRDLRRWLVRARDAGGLHLEEPTALADLLAGAVEARCLMEYVLDRPASADARWARRLVSVLWVGLEPS